MLLQSEREKEMEVEELKVNILIINERKDKPGT